MGWGQLLAELCLQNGQLLIFSLEAEQMERSERNQVSLNRKTHPPRLRLVQWPPREAEEGGWLHSWSGEGLCAPTWSASARSWEGLRGRGDLRHGEDLG